MENGYLVLNSREAIDLFNELTISGTVWEQISVLFNDYALNKKKNENVETKVDDLQKIILGMVKTINSMNSQLPAPSNITVGNNDIVEPNKVEIKEIKKTKVSSSFESLMSKMNKFK